MTEKFEIKLSNDEAGSWIMLLIYGILGTITPTALLFYSAVKITAFTTGLVWGLLVGTIFYTIATMLLLIALIRIAYLHEKYKKMLIKK